MKRLVITLLSAVAGYVGFAILGYGATLLFSPNMHDLELEAAMTGVFVSGPLGVLVGAVLGAWLSRPGTSRA